MGASVSVIAYSSTESKEFQKHFKAVQFCIDNDLSYPKETSEFFKGKIHGGDLEDYSKEYILDNIKDGVQVKMPLLKDDYYEIKVKVSDIPSEVDMLVIKMSY